ncbi:carbohydrate esterase family 4 protein [Sistotremastrum suecicum HHB10207 ss-3]|uniref:Carbohydrate esterase family 4 protein n=1 Tax=Sistotremastrum suecicum HHB10207 ss-3 TaxID=1314776 RepID=A0A166EQ80_9AGAM|nr:carbohydrate esterase family 4 protein [Sistotremastrum suecicum HHB10207 ss-3]
MLKLSFAILALCVSSVFSTPVKKRALAAIYSSCIKDNDVALTFDDGPYIYEQDISDTLTQYGAKGTFFVNGDNWACIYDPDMASQVVHAYNAGHQFGSHTWQHQDLSTLSWDNVHDQMWRTEQALQKIIGVSPAFMRPPYGNYNDNVRAAAANRNQSLVLWDFDSGDSTGSSVSQSEQAYTNLLNTWPDNILPLNHETYETTAHDILPWLLQQLNDRGYNMVTLATCLGKSPYKKEGTTYQPSPRDNSWVCGSTNSK